MFTYPMSLHVFDFRNPERVTFFTSQLLITDAVCDERRNRFWSATLNGLYVLLSREGGELEMKREIAVGDGNIVGIEPGQRGEV